MGLLKGFGLVFLAVVAIAVGYSVLFICDLLTAKVETVATVTAAAVKPDYSQFTIRELKAIAKGTGIKSWERLRKADLVAALALI